MPEKIFDPTIHQDLDHLEGFKFRYLALMEGIESFKSSNAQYRDASCGTLAQLSGLAESTLKKLKRGEINDPRLSTCWLVCKAFKIDPRKLMGLPMQDAALAAGNAHSPTIQALLDEKDKRIAELERGLGKREMMIGKRNRVLCVLLLLFVALFIADLLLPQRGWLHFQ